MPNPGSFDFPIISTTEEESVRKEALIYPTLNLKTTEEFRAWQATHPLPPPGLTCEEFNLWLEDQDDIVNFGDTDG